MSSVSTHHWKLIILKVMLRILMYYYVHPCWMEPWLVGHPKIIRQRWKLILVDICPLTMIIIEHSMGNFSENGGDIYDMAWFRTTAIAFSKLSISITLLNADDHRRDKEDSDGKICWHLRLISHICLVLVGRCRISLHAATNVHGTVANRVPGVKYKLH